MSGPTLDEVSRDLRASLETDSGDISRAFIEVRDTCGSREVTILANKEGLIHLAEQLVSLAVSATPDKHVHIDEAGMADHCDRNLVITYAAAPWD